MWIDTHCHLDYLPAKGLDLDAVMAFAREQDVSHIVTIATKTDTPIKELVSAYDHVYGTIGVHPHSVESDPIDAQTLRCLIDQTPKVVGVGETGLDYYYDNADRSVQRQAFEHHIEVASERGLPVIVHTRDADADTLAIMRAARNDGKSPTFIIHCFTRDRDFAEAVLDMGAYISFSGIVTFKSATELQEVARIVPLDRILLETDAPFLTPVPHRGKTNQPGYVPHTAAFVAGLRAMEIEQLAETVRANTRAVFPAIGQ